MPHLLKPTDLLALARLPKDQTRFEVRLYAAVVTALFVATCLGPALLILLDPFKSALHWLVVVSFVTAAGLALPHLYTLVCAPHMLSRRRPRLLAIWGTTTAAFVWLFLGTFAEPHQYGADPSPWFYWLRAIGCLLVAAIYAWSLNNQLLRENDRPASVD